MQSDVKTTASQGHLRGSLGTARIVFLVVAAASPLIVVAGAVPVMLGYGNGAGVPLTYIVVAAVLLVFSVGYTAMSRHVAEPGAFYAYVTAGLGRRAGRGAAGLALLTYSAVQAAVYGLSGAVLNGIVMHYVGVELPWWIYSLGLLLIVAALGYRSIDFGTKILAVLITLELAILTAVTFAILSRGGAAGFDAVSFTPDAFFSGAPGIAVVFAVASFIGFEATTIYREEARNPIRTIPRATYLGVIVIGVCYALASWAIVLAFGSSMVREAAQNDVSGLTFAAAHDYAGPTIASLMELLLVVSLFTALLAFHNAVARYLYSMGQRGDAISWLGRVHPRHGSPSAGSAVQTVSAAVIIVLFALAGSDPVLNVFTWLSGLATLGLLVLMVLVSVAIVTFFSQRGGLEGRWNTRVAPVLGTLGVFVLLLLVLANFTTLIEGSARLAAFFIVLIVLAFSAGALAPNRSEAQVGS